MTTQPPDGERGTIRLPWDALPRTAVRNAHGTWIRSADSGEWFALKSDYTAGTAFTPDPLSGQCAHCVHNADAHDTEDGHCLVNPCDCAGFEVQS